MFKARFKKIFKNEVVLNVLTLFSGSTLAQLFPFLIYPLLSRLYTPEDFGTLSLFSNLMIILSVFATGKYERAIMLPAGNVNAINITGFCLLLITFFWSLTMAVSLLFGRYIAEGLGDPGLYPWIYLLPFSIAFYSVFQVMSSILNRQKRYRSMAASRVVQSFGSSGVKLAGGFLQAGRGGLITGNVLGQMMSAAFLFLRFYFNNKGWLKLISKKRMKEQVKEYIFFPKYNMLHVLSNSISAGLPVFFFTRFFSIQETGLYSMGYNVVFVPLSLFAVALGQVLYQNISEKHNSQKKLTPLLFDTIKTVLLISVIPFILVMLFAPEIFSFVLGREWEVSGKFLQIILPWLFMVLLTSPLSFLPNIFKRQKKAMFIELISFVFRFAALSAGAYYDNLKIALILYTIVSFSMVAYCFIWYLRLSVSYDKKLNNI